MEHENSISWPEIHAALLVCWDGETAKGDWDEAEPSLNQCAVSALVVQDYLGGLLLRAPMTNDDGHYYNCLPDGRIRDATRAQFEFIREYPLRDQAEMRTRKYVLSYPDTVKRYELLSARVERYLGKQIWEE